MTQGNRPIPIDELLSQAGWLRDLASSLVRDPATAEEVVQETWVAALRHPPEQRGRTRAWLGRVARNVAHNLQRAGRRRSELEGQVEGGSAQPADSPDRLAEEAEAQRLVAQHVAALPEALRDVVILRYYRGNDSSEIARKLGIPAGTVRWRLSKALESLRAALDRESDGERDVWISSLAPFALQAATSTPSVPPRISPTGTSIAPLVTGGLVMKKLALAVALLLLGGLTWRMLIPNPPTQLAGQAAVPDALESLLPSASGTETEQSKSATVQREEVTSLTHGSLTIRALWDDGTAAADVGVFLQRSDVPLSAGSVERLRTDAAGTIRLEDCPVGSIEVRGDRGGIASTQILPAEENLVTLKLPAGVDLEGSVTDEEGNPLPDAEIFLVARSEDGFSGRGRDWLSMRTVTHSDASGNFQVRSVSPEFSVTARKGDRMPADLKRLDGESPGGVVHLILVLESSALALHGIVRDTDGHPIAHAVVGVGRTSSSITISAGGVWKRESYGSNVVETKEDGTFQAYGIRQDTGGLGMSVAVVAPGHALWSGRVAGSLGAVSYLEIVLEDPATVEGTVCYADGRPVPGAEVTIKEINSRPAHKLLFPLPRATTDSAGNYSLEGMTPGRNLLRFEPSESSKQSAGIALVDVSPGDLYPLDVVLPADDVIRGRVQDHMGRALEGYCLRALAAVTNHNRRPVETDAEGRFSLPDCGDPPYSLRLYEPGGEPFVQPGMLRLAQRKEGVSAGAEVVFVVPESGRVFGVFEDEVEHAASEAAVAQGSGPRAMDNTGTGLFIGLSDQKGIARPEMSYEGNAEGGRFEFASVPPGSYHLYISRSTNRLLLYQSERFELAPGEALNLGTIASKAVGSIALQLNGMDANTGVGGIIKDDRFVNRAFLHSRGKHLVAEGLFAGVWYLDIEAAGYSVPVLAVEVLPGEETSVSLTLKPGAARTLSFTLPPESEWNEMRVKVHDVSGQLLVVHALKATIGNDASLLVTLPKGSFRLEAETNTGFRVQGDFRVRSLMPQDAPLTFSLK